MMTLRNYGKCLFTLKVKRLTAGSRVFEVTLKDVSLSVLRVSLPWRTHQEPEEQGKVSDMFYSELQIHLLWYKTQAQAMETVNLMNIRSILIIFANPLGDASVAEMTSFTCNDH